MNEDINGFGGIMLNGVELFPGSNSSVEIGDSNSGKDYLVLFVASVIT